MVENSKHTPGAGHEQTDIHEGAVGKFAVGLLAITVVVILLVFGVFRYFLSREGGVPSGRSQNVAAAPEKSFPQPQLQQTPVIDLKAIRAEEDKVLNTYAWADPEKSVVRIPIGRAIDVLAQRGLPSRPQAEPPAGESK
jgi:hypothetical protein